VRANVETSLYPVRMTPEPRIRIVTATSLFDGHDAAINIMRRILQASGAEVIHLGHDRSAAEIAEAAIEEDAHAVAVTSYQGGHMEFFRYLRGLLDDAGGTDIAIFGGGGGTILPAESAELAGEGTARIYSPDDGRELGLQGMIDDLMSGAAHQQNPLGTDMVDRVLKGDHAAIARAITLAEGGTAVELLSAIKQHADLSKAPVVGFTGTGGSVKSSILDELVRRFLSDHPDKTIAVISVDPSRRRTGGALLGDRIRMNSVTGDSVFMRSLATRQANLSMSPFVNDAVNVVKAAGFDLILLETSGIGQSDTEIVDASDVSVYVMTPEFGAATQLEKIDMLDFADVIAINKSDRRGADDALRDVRKQVRRNHVAFDIPDADLAVVGTIASSFNDSGTQRLYELIMKTVERQHPASFEPVPHRTGRDTVDPVIPRNRVRYLSEISETIRDYDAQTVDLATKAADLEALTRVADLVSDSGLEARIVQARAELGDATDVIDSWEGESERYGGDAVSYEVRGRTITVDNTIETLSGTHFPRVAYPRTQGWADRVRWARSENLPGRFPYTAGVFPFKRQVEDPTRMFAGEGGPEQTNRRFHYLASGMPFTRLSTAFDSVTLYGHDPDVRPDIFGKVGNSGVSISTLDDAKKLYSGFDLLDPATSVSMTINGPAPMMLAFFMNAAIDQACESYIVEQGLAADVEQRITEIYAERDERRPCYRGSLPPGHNGSGLMLLGISGADMLPPDVYDTIKAETLATVRGTIQADILKEDQAQNTCIFSTEFALSMQGDIQQYFVDKDVKNFYSVSISGYHMAEAGANPITQLAFTLANGFTFVEYFLSRGMDIDEFAGNLSFFFSNGLDPEYAVIGRVARRIWAKAMRDMYGADERSQKLKYHIQTSGRSLHAQEIEFNDIRTTLQALYGVYDNCNSMHTNAYDEAITTPTEDSVRRALAIQLIINKELGLARSENPLQGSTIIAELTDLVEEAVLAEFDRLTDRGGVLGAMETMYQRSKIQEESLRYETKKDSGELEIIGVNTFLSKEGSPFITPEEVVRSTDADKLDLIRDLEALHQRDPVATSAALEHLQHVALDGGNIFEALVDASPVCSLGQMSNALFTVGGRYRRNM
jgi:methylmalonyl-CoA mutase